MPKITVVVGLLLCALPFIAWAIAKEITSITMFIPAFVGVPIFLLGLFSVTQPGLRKHLMHAAVTVGLLGALAALGRGIPQLIKIFKGEAVDWLPVSMVWSMAIICITFVLMCIESFVSARRARTSENAKPS